MRCGASSRRDPGPHGPDGRGPGCRRPDRGTLRVRRRRGGRRGWAALGVRAARDGRPRHHRGRGRARTTMSWMPWTGSSRARTAGTGIATARRGTGRITSCHCWRRRPSRSRCWVGVWRWGPGSRSVCWTRTPTTPHARSAWPSSPADDRSRPRGSPLPLRSAPRTTANDRRPPRGLRSAQRPTARSDRRSAPSVACFAKRRPAEPGPVPPPAPARPAPAPPRRCRRAPAAPNHTFLLMTARHGSALYSRQPQPTRPTARLPGYIHRMPTDRHRHDPPRGHRRSTRCRCVPIPRTSR